MRMDFLPFPRGASAKGDTDGNVLGSASFFSTKGQPLLNVLAGETDSAQVLISTAFLDRALKRCLKTLFKVSGTNGDQRQLLIGSHGSILGSFGAKIVVSRGFGLLEKGPADTLEAIKELRNAFAHNDFAIRLDSDDEKVRKNMVIVQEWLATVEYCAYAVDKQNNRIPVWFVELLNIGEVKAAESVTARHQFLGAVLMLYVGLTNIQWAIDPATYNGAVVVSTSPQSPAQPQSNP